MSQQSSILSKRGNSAVVHVGCFVHDEDDRRSTLQALIDILRKPQPRSSPTTIERDDVLTAASAEVVSDHRAGPVLRGFVRSAA